MTRSRLPDRRACETFEFVHLGKMHTASVGRYADGRLSEIFVDTDKRDAQPDAVAVRDAAVAASLAFQHGVTAAELSAALERDSATGSPLGPIGKAVALAEGAQQRWDGAVVRQGGGA